MKYIVVKIDRTENRDLSDIAQDLNNLTKKYGANIPCESIGKVRDKFESTDELVIDNINNRSEDEREELIIEAIDFACNGYKVNIDEIIDIDEKTAHVLKIIKDNIDFSTDNKEQKDAEQDRLLINPVKKHEESIDTVDIAEDCLVSEPLIDNIISYTKIDESLEEKVLRLKSLGLTKKEIANQCNTTGNQVKKILSNTGRNGGN